MAARHSLRVQTRKLRHQISTFSFHISVSHLLFGPRPKILAEETYSSWNNKSNNVNQQYMSGLYAKQVRGLRASAGLQVKWRQVVK